MRGSRATMKLEALNERRQPLRKIQGIAAALLPYETDGRVAVEAFQRHLLATHRAGLMNAVNMESSYVNFLSDAEQQQVLRWTREAVGQGVPFVAGAYVEDRDGKLAPLYRRRMDEIVAAGGIPILFQTARLHGKPAREKIAVYQAAAKGYEHVLCFELGRMFAPNGGIFDGDTVRGLMDIPELKGRRQSFLTPLIS